MRTQAELRDGNKIIIYFSPSLNVNRKGIPKKKGKSARFSYAILVCIALGAIALWGYEYLHEPPTPCDFYQAFVKEGYHSTVSQKYIEARLKSAQRTKRIVMADGKSLDPQIYVRRPDIYEGIEVNDYLQKKPDSDTLFVFRDHKRLAAYRIDFGCQ